MSRRLINLCFHGIGTPARELEPGEDRYWITEELFLAVLDEVSDREDVRLSFDDGNASDALIGLPALVERGLAGTFFALAGRLDQQGSLSGAQLRELAAAGMTIGTHGMEHVPWRGLDQVSRRRELIVARRMLEEASAQTITECALPLGRYDRRTLGHLRAAGYAAVHSSDRRPAWRGGWMQPRYSLRKDDSIDAVRTDVLGANGLNGRSLMSQGAAEAKGLVKRLR